MLKMIRLNHCNKYRHTSLKRLKKAFGIRMDPAITEAADKCAKDEFRSTYVQLEYMLTHALLKAGRYPKKWNNLNDNQQNN